MVELTVEIKIGIFVAFLIIGYFILRYFEMDPIVGFWEAISGLEWNLTALVLTLLFSSMMWIMVWKSPIWVNSTAFGTGSRIFLTVALPIVGYPLAVRALSK